MTKTFILRETQSTSVIATLKAAPNIAEVSFDQINGWVADMTHGEAKAVKDLMGNIRIEGGNYNGEAHIINDTWILSIFKTETTSKIEEECLL